jgi:hypothetical protein
MHRLAVRTCPFHRIRWISGITPVATAPSLTLSAGGQAAGSTVVTSVRIRATPDDCGTAAVQNRGAKQASELLLVVIVEGHSLQTELKSPRSCARPNNRLQRMRGGACFRVEETLVRWPRTPDPCVVRAAGQASRDSLHFTNPHAAARAVVRTGKVTDSTSSERFCPITTFPEDLCRSQDP